MLETIITGIEAAATSVAESAAAATAEISQAAEIATSAMETIKTMSNTSEATLGVKASKLLGEGTTVEKTAETIKAELLSVKGTLQKPVAAAEKESVFDVFKPKPIHDEMADSNGLDVSRRLEVEEAKKKLEDVKRWLPEVNPNYNPFSPSSPFNSNCGACAFSVESRLSNTIPNAVAGARNIGTDEQMEAITGKVCKYMSPQDIEKRLKLMGPGSHLIVGINRKNSLFVFPQAGHWFNAFYDGEKIHTLDGQTGLIHDWPHDYGDVSAWCALV